MANTLRLTNAYIVVVVLVVVVLNQSWNIIAISPFLRRSCHVAKPINRLNKMGSRQNRNLASLLSPE